MENQNFDWATNYKGVDTSNFDLLRRIKKRLNQRSVLFGTIEKLLPIQADNRPKILEVACGMAIEANILSAVGYEVTGIDSEVESIRFGQKVKRFFNSDIQVKPGNAFKLDFPENSFDLVFSQGFLEHFSDKEIVALISEQVRVIKPNGFLLIDIPNKISAYTSYKKLITLFHKEWFFGFERQFSKNDLIDFVKTASGAMKHAKDYGWSFYGYPTKSKADFLFMIPLLGLRTFCQIFKKGHDNIGVLFQKT